MAQGVKNYCLDSKKKGQIRNEFDPSGMWWSWRELNPRPQAIFVQFYMCSRLI